MGRALFLNPFYSFLFSAIFLLLGSSSASPSPLPVPEVQRKDPSREDTVRKNEVHLHYQKFSLQNAGPSFSIPQDESSRQRKTTKKKNSAKRKNLKNIQARPFFVMLPKGFVPPSGSYPCHNHFPDSLSFHCHLSAAEP